MKGKYLIGITGGIGSGKSTVSRFWSAYAGLPLVDADQLCRDLLEVGLPGWSALKELLGETYFFPDGRLDRQFLRSAIFDDEDLRHKIDKLIHPRALDLLHRKIANIDGPVLVDVPLLFEAGWQGQFQSTVVVFADRHACCRRVSGRDKIPPEDAMKAIRAQMDIREKAILADHVVDNRYCWLMTRMEVAHLAGVLGEKPRKAE